MKTLIRRVKNIIRWLPVIWQDRDFDYQYLLDITAFKLLNMYKFFSSDNTVCADSDKVALEIKEVLDALVRYRNNDYCKAWYDLLYQKHGEISLSNGAVFNLTFPQSNDNERALRIERSLSRRADDLQQQDFEFVFDTLKSKLQEWWD